METKWTERFSQALNLNFRTNGKLVVFEDGVVYTAEETVLLAGLPAEMMQKVHLIKSKLEATVIKRGAECS